MKKLHYSFMFIVLLAATWQLGSAAYIHVKAYVAQQLLLSAWDKTLRGETKVKPWSWSDTWPVARLKMARLNQDIIILAGDSGRNLAFAPGYRFGTALPGTHGVSMISAHRDTYFRFLNEIKQGDELSIIDSAGQETIYAVTRTQIVNQRNAAISMQTTEKSLVLVTCYPFTGLQENTNLRYLVYAYEVKNNAIKKQLKGV